MKRAFLLAIGLCACAALVSADYLNPPGWDSDPYFTHQSWSFTTPDNPSIPDDGGAGNPYGTAMLTFSNAVWEDQLGMVYDADSYVPLGERQGGWSVSGPQAQTEWLRIEIPNSPNPNMHKELWFEMTFRVSDPMLAAGIVDRVDLQVYANGLVDDAHKFTVLPTDGGLFGVDDMIRPWLRFAGRFSFDPQPGSEVFLLTGSLDPGQGVMLDQIDIDTHCVPEPATLCLFGLGALGLIRRKR